MAAELSLPLGGCQLVVHLCFGCSLLRTHCADSPLSVCSLTTCVATPPLHPHHRPSTSPQFQCEQTNDNKGCTTVGVCGKTPTVAGLQDLLIYHLKGLGSWAHLANEVCAGVFVGTHQGGGGGCVHVRWILLVGGVGRGKQELCAAQPQ